MSGGAEENLLRSHPAPSVPPELCENRQVAHSSIDREPFEEELLLVAKRSVKTRPIDAHGPRQVGERSAFVTFGPKNVHGTIQGRVRIEGARSSARCCCNF